MSYFANSKIAKYVGQSLKGQSMFQSFAGTDITVVAYLPLTTKNTVEGRVTSKYKKFAEIQTISISSTRSVSPVRVLGRSSPLAYTRGARTFAGTMVFASLNHDVFQEIYDLDIMESSLYHSTSMVSDQLPPFSIVITAANEKGAAAQQAIHGITLVNYGTVYSIDDLYTEVTYSYVAQDVTPFTNLNTSAAGQGPFVAGSSTSEALKTITQLAEEDPEMYPVGSIRVMADARKYRKDQESIANTLNVSAEQSVDEPAAITNPFPSPEPLAPETTSLSENRLRNEGLLKSYGATKARNSTRVWVPPDVIDF